MTVNEKERDKGTIVLGQSPWLVRLRNPTFVMDPFCESDDVFLLQYSTVQYSNDLSSSSNRNANAGGGRFWSSASSFGHPRHRAVEFGRMPSRLVTRVALALALQCTYRVCTGN